MKRHHPQILRPFPQLARSLGQISRARMGKIFHLECAVDQLIRTRFVQIDAKGIGNGDTVFVLMDSNDFVSGADFSFAKHAQL